MVYVLKILILVFLIISLLLAFFIMKTKSFKNKQVFLISDGIVTILLGLFLISYFYFDKFKINPFLLLNLLITILNLILIVVLMKIFFQTKDNINKYKILDDYQQKSTELIEKYSTMIHKYQNNLIAIKGYIHKGKDQADNYIDSLLGEFKINKYRWFQDLNYLQNDIIRYLIYYKLTKAENADLKITVVVSKDVKKIKKINLANTDLNLFLEIIGEYFDNALYASKESKEKELHFNLYLENDNLIFKIANTYDGKINLDLITKQGYTTKGQGHGLGLYDIARKIKEIPNLETKYELLDNYFVVVLKLNLE